MKITQKSLRSVVKLQAQLAALSEKLKSAEASVFDALKGGAEVQSGLLSAHIKTFERRNVAWKKIVEREKGEEFAARILAATHADKYENLVVELANKAQQAA